MSCKHLTVTIEKLTLGIILSGLDTQKRNYIVNQQFFPRDPNNLMFKLIFNGNNTLGILNSETHYTADKFYYICHVSR